MFIDSVLTDVDHVILSWSQANELGFDHIEVGRSLREAHYWPEVRISKQAINSHILSTLLLISASACFLHRVDPLTHSSSPLKYSSYLGTRHDLAVLVRGVQLGLRITQTQPLAPLIVRSDADPLLDHVLHRRGDADVESWVRKHVETLYHPTSTARMAPKEKGGVVDARLRVYGVKGLRVVDASVFPTIVAGRTVNLFAQFRIIRFFWQDIFV